MKYLLAQPASHKFQWELDVVLTNIRSMDKETPILLLFTTGYQMVVDHFKDRYANLEIHVYNDERKKKDYYPSVRPYLCYKYFTEFPEASHEAYFQIDSDIIFRQMPDWSTMPLDGLVCWASDCGAYIDYDYLITRRRGAYIVDRFAEIFHLTVDQIKATPGGGAQWLINKPTADYWWRVWHDSDNLSIMLEYMDTDLQKWTAEMWAQLYNLVRFGYEIKLSDELSFCRPTDDIRMWDQVNILHNAGVLGEQAHKMFFKGEYLMRSPFKANLNFVQRDRASIKYVEAIHKVIQ